MWWRSSQEVRRQWDMTHEIGNLIDAVTPNSTVAHVLFNHAIWPASAAWVPRDALLWRHWMRLLPDTATAADTDAAQTGGGFIVVGVSTLHSNCAPVNGYLRASVGLEAWHIRPIAYSVRSEVTHFFSFSPGGWLGGLGKVIPHASEASLRPFYERLGALAIYANAKHGCLAVPLPRDVGAAESDDDGAAGADEAGRPVRAFQPSTGLAQDMHATFGVPWELRTAAHLGGTNGFSQPKVQRAAHTCPAHVLRSCASNPSAGPPGPRRERASVFVLATISPTASRCRRRRMPLTSSPSSPSRPSRRSSTLRISRTRPFVTFELRAGRRPSPS